MPFEPNFPIVGGLDQDGKTVPLPNQKKVWEDIGVKLPKNPSDNAPPKWNDPVGTPTKLYPWEIPGKDAGDGDPTSPTYRIPGLQPLEKALYNTEMPWGGVYNTTFDPALDDVPGDWKSTFEVPSAPYKDWPTERQAQEDWWEWENDHGPISIPKYEIDGKSYYDPWDPNNPNRPPMPPHGKFPPPWVGPERTPIETQYYDDEAHRLPPPPPPLS